MAGAREISFELERFEWTADDRLVVLGRWTNLRGRRAARPTLTVEAGGRQRLSALPGGRLDEPDTAWEAAFPWDGSGGEITGAELEVGRALVVELPPPRRRRRRAGAGAGEEANLRAQVEDLRAMLAELRAERAAAPSTAEVAALTEAAERGQREAAQLREQLARQGGDGDETLRDELAAAHQELVAARELGERLEVELAAARESGDGLEVELAAAHEARDRLEVELAAAGEAGVDVTQMEAELAGLRLAHGSLRDAHERLEDETEALRGVRDERDHFAAELQQLRTGAGETEQARTELGVVLHEVQNRAAAAERERDRLTEELRAARQEITALRDDVAARERELERERVQSARRIDAERATTTEVHSRLATAREQAQDTITAEAAETERLRAELSQVREESERSLADERAEVARLREELVGRPDAAGEEGAEGSRRMVERVTRDLERERATSRSLRRELDDLRSSTAEERRAVSSATANGSNTLDEPPVRALRTPEGTRRRVDAARAHAARRVPRTGPSTAGLWVVRILSALMIAGVGIAIVLLVSAVR